MKKIVFLSLFLISVKSFTQYWNTVSTNANHNVGIQSNGTLWTWGSNIYGQLGDGTTINKLVPTQIGMDTDWVLAVAGSYETYAIKQNGTLWAWGRNDKGQLSDGTTTPRLLPAQVLPGTTWSKIASGNKFIVAQKLNGTLWSCGQGGIIGFNDSTDRYTLEQISNDTDWLEFNCGISHTILQKTNHTVWGFGSGDLGKLATGNDNGYGIPTQLFSGTNWIQTVAGKVTSMFKKNDGTLWGIGQNVQGTLGIGNNESGVYILTQAGMSNDWASLNSGTFNLHTMALKTNGTLWATGLNNSGQLGNGTTTNTNDFVQIGIATNWENIYCGVYHTLALDTNGTLWAWGDNSQGQLGNGTTTNSLVPIQIGTTCTLNTPYFKQSSVRLLSNPVEDIVQLSFNSDGTKKIEVYNSLGVLLTTKTISSDFISFDVSGYASGVYFVKCSMGDKVETVKVVKR